MFGGNALADGVAVYSTDSIPAGSHAITAWYGGNSDFDNSVSSALVQGVYRYLFLPLILRSGP
jgi:hypothetical protein